MHNWIAHPTKISIWVYIVPPALILLWSFFFMSVWSFIFFLTGFILLYVGIKWKRIGALLFAVAVMFIGLII